MRSLTWSSNALTILLTNENTTHAGKDSDEEDEPVTRSAIKSGQSPPTPTPAKKASGFGLIGTENVAPARRRGQAFGLGSEEPSSTAPPNQPRERVLPQNQGWGMEAEQVPSKASAGFGLGSEGLGPQGGNMKTQGWGIGAEQPQEKARELNSKMQGWGGIGAEGEGSGGPSKDVAAR